MPFYDHLPDDAFPCLVGIGHIALIGLPDRGNGLIRHCTACGHETWFGGEDLCRLFPAWLTRDVYAWAAAMPCDACPSPRQVFHCRADKAAQGFGRGPGDPTEGHRLRRLAAWLPAGGLRIDDVAYLLEAIDARKVREAGFDVETSKLFTSAETSAHYRPTRQPNRAVVPSPHVQPLPPT